MREWFLVALMFSLCFTGHVVAEEESDPFTAAGLDLVALRNDGRITWCSGNQFNKSVG